LLDLARGAIAAHVAGRAEAGADAALADAELADATPSERADRVDPAERQHGGVFVSLHRQGRLRGWIGTLDATVDLEEAVGEAAVAACSSDPRFAPLSATELTDLEIEISILGVIERVTDVETIEVGRHGLIVEVGQRRGVLLPQVAIEWSWTREEFLARTCEKAGLHRDAWKAGATISRFEVEIVGP
jgi:AmmeMemoRadiSam system protein A